MNERDAASFYRRLDEIEQRARAAEIGVIGDLICDLCEALTDLVAELVEHPNQEAS